MNQIEKQGKMLDPIAIANAQNACVCFSFQLMIYATAYRDAPQKDKGNCL